MKAKKLSSSSELHGADETGYLRFGVVDACHDASCGALHWLSGDARKAGGISRNLAHESSTVSHRYGAHGLLLNKFYHPKRTRINNMGHAAAGI